MKSLTIAVGCVLLVLCPFATSGKPVGNKEKKPLSTLQQYAKLTSKAKAIRLEMTVKITAEKDMDGSGKLGVVGERKTGRYAFKAEMTMREGDRVSTESVAFVHAAGETIKWRTQDGEIQNARKRRQPKNAKLPAYVRDLGPLCFIYDGLYGYKLLAKEITLKPGNPPDHKKDGLTWYLVSPVKHKKQSEFQEKMSLDQASVWLGFSPKDGWIHGLVCKEKDDMTVVLKVTKIDYNPKLKGAFDLPADVKAKLDENEKEGRIKLKVAPAE